MTDAHISCYSPWCWCKSNQNEELVSTVQAVETLLVGTYTDTRTTTRMERKWDGASRNKEWKNPLKRHNFLSFPNLTASQRLKDDKGKVVNQHEKPPRLIYEFLDRMLQSSMNVLIIGAGSGGDVVGALKSKCVDIIALEPDEYQFKCLLSRLLRLQSLDPDSHDYKFL